MPGRGAKQHQESSKAVLGEKTRDGVSRRMRDTFQPEPATARARVLENRRRNFQDWNFF